jgi:hypothetical protein
LAQRGTKRLGSFSCQLKQLCETPRCVLVAARDSAQQCRAGVELGALFELRALGAPLLALLTTLGRAASRLLILWKHLATP